MNHPESSYRAAKRYLQTWITIKSETKSIVLIVLGIFSASFGFKGFLLTNHFIDGGVTGISLLISETTKFPVSILIVLINIPFVIMSYFTLGKHFAFKTGFAIIGLGLCLAMVEFPNITNDKLLVAVFGGIFFVTTEFAPIKEFSPIVTPFKTTQFIPIQTPSLITILFGFPLLREPHNSCLRFHQ